MIRVLLRPGVAQALARQLITITCAILLASGGAAWAQQPTPQQQPTEQAVKIPPEQLDSLVAPIALYPDPLLSQTLVASTYPLEIIQLEQFLEKNPGLKDKALVDAVSKQPWDPSVQAMAPLPDLAKRLADDIQWTTDLGNAFLAQQSDVMGAIQRMRGKAESTGALTSNEHQKVETQVVDNKSVIVVEQASPEVVYVPDYNPEAVYGPAVYPYPPIAYPAYTPGIFAASAISWGVGVAMGAAWGGGWGWGAGWGRGDVNMNFNNSFNRAANINRAGNIAGGNRTWQHNPQHRGGAPYADARTANRFGSNARGDSLANRQRGARQQIARQGGNLGSAGNRGGVGNRPGGGNLGGAGSGFANRPGGGNLGGAGGRPGGGNLGGAGGRPGGGNLGGAGGRPGGGNLGGAGGRPGGGNLGGAGGRPGGGNLGGAGGRPGGGNLGGAGGRPGGGNLGGAGGRPGGGDRVGNRSVGRSGDRGGLGGGSGFNGRSARSSSSRGASSMSRSRGGGGGRSRGGGGGGRGGGGRGGGRR